MEALCSGNAKQYDGGSMERLREQTPLPNKIFKQIWSSCGDG